MVKKSLRHAVVSLFLSFCSIIGLLVKIIIFAICHYKSMSISCIFAKCDGGVFVMHCYS